jgi:acetyltransferase-like isoleucine patch superfamily enzyme
MKNYIFRLLHRYYFLLKNKTLTLGKGVMIFKNCQLEDYIIVGSNSILNNTHIGSYSYLGSNCKIHYTIIGKFCSIGSDVKIGLSNHPTRNFVSTSPYFYLPNFNGNKNFVDKQFFEPHKSINIGNDVYIGSNALVLDGVTIGDGAIIAAGAIVTKNVEPYSIVAGVPAKEIRKRFSEKEILQLLELNGGIKI